MKLEIQKLSFFPPEPLTQLIMQSQPILMITMAIVVAIHGTTLATLNQMMEQVSYFSLFGIFWHGAVDSKIRVCIVGKCSTMEMYSVLEITLFESFLLF